MFKQSKANSQSLDSDNGKQARGSISPSRTLCRVCAGTFKNVTSLNAHMRRKHPAERHDDMVAANIPIKARWTDEETMQMANLEATLTFKNTKFMNKALVEVIPGRSLESIKGQRKGMAYKQLVKSLIENASLAGPSKPVVTDIPKADVRDRRDSNHVFPSRRASPINERPEILPTFLSDIKQLRLTEDECRLLCRVDIAQSTKQDLIDNEYSRWIGSATVVANINKPLHNSEHAKKNQTRKKRLYEKRKHGVVQPHSSNRKQKRRDAYKRVQALYNKDPSRAADLVLSGEWDTEQKSLDSSVLIPYWSDIFAQPSVPNVDQIDCKVDPILELQEPFTTEEVLWGLKTIKDASPGVDNLRRSDLKGISIGELKTHFNLWVYIGLPPSAFKIGKTILIPKARIPNGPGEYRPITMGSMISRILHRIIAKRLELMWPLSERQKAFRKGDGLFDNSWLLESIVRDRRSRFKPTHLAFLDVSKAFDSVSHESIVQAARRLGTPDRLLKYITNFHIGLSTSVHCGKVVSDTIKVGRGVRQGDPLSPLLFNAVADWGLSLLDDSIGVSSKGGHKLNHMAFADDIILFAETKIGLQNQVNNLCAFFVKRGLSLNATKSATLSIPVSAKKKQWWVDRTPFVKVDNDIIPGLGPEQHYKYLGIRFTIAGTRKSATKIDLLKKLCNISKAPLKPQQRLRILNVYLLPSVYHQLVIDDYGVSDLSVADKKIRKFVRSWLHVPHDVPTSFIHARVRDGGLGVPCFRRSVPAWRVKRMNSMLNRSETNDDKLMIDFTREDTRFTKNLRKWTAACTCNGVGLFNANDTAANFAATLTTNTVDGRGLKEVARNSNKVNWLRCDGSIKISGKDFVRCVQVRASTLYNKLRASRGVAQPDIICSKCGQVDSLSHRIQVCHVTGAARDERHDRLVLKVKKKLEQLAYKTHLEPAIYTGSGYRRPDLVYWNDSHAGVMDVSIVSDLANLQHEYDMKRDKYNVEEVLTWVQARAGVPVTAVGGIIYNWRGAVSKSTLEWYRSIGFSSKFTDYWEVFLLTEAYRIWAAYRAGTYRMPARFRGYLVAAGAQAQRVYGGEYKKNR